MIALDLLIHLFPRSALPVTFNASLNIYRTAMPWNEIIQIRGCQLSALPKISIKATAGASAPHFRSADHHPGSKLVAYGSICSLDDR